MYTTIFNFLFFIFLLLGIQNSKQSQKIIFLDFESAKMPESFIIGSSFITGSLIASLTISILKLETKKWLQSYKDNNKSSNIILVIPFNLKFFEAIKKTFGFGILINFRFLWQCFFADFWSEKISNVNLFKSSSDI